MSLQFVYALQICIQDEGHEDARMLSIYQNVPTHVQLKTALQDVWDQECAGIYADEFVLLDLSEVATDMINSVNIHQSSYSPFIKNKDYDEDWCDKKYIVGAHLTRHRVI